MKRLNASLDAQSRSTMDGQRGQVLVMLAIFMIALLAVMALVFDGGGIYVQRRRMQNAADAGALAGARILADNRSNEAGAIATAQSYASANAAGAAQVTINPKGVTVTACRDVQTTFARVIGLSQVSVCARASAAYAPVTDLKWLRPIAIPFANYNTWTEYTLWDDDQDHQETYSISGRGYLNLSLTSPAGCTSAGASTLRNWMINGYPGTLSLGDWVCRDPGVIASLLKNVQVGDCLPIVVYDQLSPSGYYRIVMFARFCVTFVDATGNDKRIMGMFDKDVTSGTPDTGSQYGDWLTVYLTE